jgi:DNA replication and repair protein RecF
MAAGRTLSGPHRTDLSVIHRPTGMPAGEASTGQQKALLIGLILASAKALSQDGEGPSPILLLDEAAAHLDADRRAALFDELCALGGQAWLTGTESFLFEAFQDRAQRFEIRDGEAREA